MADLIPNVKIRQIITGFLFGSVGASIALSSIGKVSGAHINPAVTMVFWLFRKIEGRLAITYILAQVTGAIIGCLPLLIWGDLGRSINFGGTAPGSGYTEGQAFLGEVITTFTMVTLLLSLSDSGASVSLPHICFLYFMPLWCPSKPISQESVPILPAVLVLRLYLVLGMVDLLGRPLSRGIACKSGMQPAGQENNNRQTLSFR